MHMETALPYPLSSWRTLVYHVTLSASSDPASAVSCARFFTSSLPVWTASHFTGKPINQTLWIIIEFTRSKSTQGLRNCLVMSLSLISR